MKEITCSVVQDLLPLYTEDLASSDTRTLVREHLEQCPDCRKIYTEMNTATSLPTAAVPMKQLRGLLLRKSTQIVLLAVCISVLLMLTAFARLTERTPVSYSEDMLTPVESEDGAVGIVFTEGRATGRSIRYEALDGRDILWVEAWYCPLDNLLGTTAQSILIPEDRLPDRIYYSAPDEEAVLLWGKHPAQGDGVMLLSRLTLSYYRMLALLLALPLGILALVLRKKRCAGTMRVLFLIPCSWLIGQLCIQGFRTTTAYAVRDFVFILLAAAAFFGAAISAGALFSHSREARNSL